jgi:hypothetical protein
MSSKSLGDLFQEGRDQNRMIPPPCLVASGSVSTVHWEGRCNFGHPRRELGIPRLFRNRLEARLVLGFKPDRLTGKNTKQLIL